MTNTNTINNGITLIQLREYDTKVDLGNEVDVIEGLAEYGSTVHICDAITEQADAFTPICYNSIWEHVRDIQEYVEDAIAEGLVSFNSITSLDTVFQQGYYCYYSSVLNENLEDFIFNEISSSINELIKAHNLINIDLESIESEIEGHDIDNNSIFDEIEEFVKDMSERILNGEFNNEE